MQAVRSGAEKLRKRFKSATVTLSEIVIIYTKELCQQARDYAIAFTDVRIISRDEALKHLAVDQHIRNAIRHWLARREKDQDLSAK